MIFQQYAYHVVCCKRLEKRDGAGVQRKVLAVLPAADVGSVTLPLPNNPMTHTPLHWNKPTSIIPKPQCLHKIKHCYHNCGCNWRRRGSTQDYAKKYNYNSVWYDK